MTSSTQNLPANTTRNLFFGVLFFAPFIMVPWFQDCAELPRNCFLQSAIGGLFFCWLLEKNLSSTDTVFFQIPKTIGPLIIFLLWSLLSFAYAINEWEVIYRWTTWCTAFLAFFLACNLFTNLGEIKPLLRTLFFASTCIALIGINQHLFGLDIIPQSAPPASTFVNRNMAVHIIVLCLPLSLPIMFEDKYSFFDFLIPICFSLQATYLIYTTTRSGWLATSTQLIFLLFTLGSRSQKILFFTSRKKKGIVIGLLVFLSLIAIGGNGRSSGLSLIQDRILHTKYQSETGGAQVRWAYWSNSLAMLKDHPFLGVGLGNFKIHYPKYHDAYLPDRSFTVQRQAADVHNDFIQVIVELGLIGLCVALWATMKTIAYLKSLVSPQKNNAELLVIAGITAGMLGALVSMTFSFPLQQSLPPIIISVFLAVLHNLAKAHTTFTISRGKYILITIAIGVCALKVCLHQLGILQAEHFNTKSLRQALGDHYKLAAESAESAYRHQPLWHKSLYHVGAAYLRSDTPTYAIEPFRKYLESYPYDIHALSGLGAALAEKGQYKFAENYIQQSLALLQANWPAYNHLGSLFLEQQRYTEAISAFQKALEMNKGNSKLWYNLGVAKAKAGDYQSAIIDFRKAEQLEPGWQAPLQKIKTLETKALQ